MAKPGGGIGHEFALDVQVPRLAPSMFVCVCVWTRVCVWFLRVFIVPHTNDSDFPRHQTPGLLRTRSFCSSLGIVRVSYAPSPVQGAFPSSQG